MVGGNHGAKRTAPKIARGLAHGVWRRVVIALDDETFSQVRRRAVTAGHSFAEEIRVLVELGLETES